MDRIAVQRIERFRDDLRDREYAPITINAILRIMGAVFRLAIKRGQCTRNPLDSVDRAARVARELSRPPDCADHRKSLINKRGGGRGPVAPPVFKTGLAANIVAGGFDSLPPPPSG
jgi:hypothetical protein